ncbi:MAG: FtsQ-type POTRA domain-containing protein [Lentisphaeria bacterium]|nr:FtsQ-type POTRA domain-containing protein [Lentisphaeria bacterium]
MPVKSSKVPAKIKSKQSKKAESTSKLWPKVSIWAGILLTFMMLLVGIHLGLQKVFFSSNPQFVLKHLNIDVKKGMMKPQEVSFSLQPFEDLKLVQGQSNLFDVNLSEVRAKLLSDPLIKEAEVRRILPHTIELTVFGRTPSAQLKRRGGLLIDTEGYILPPSSKQELLSLPVITGIPLKENSIGEQVENKMLNSALEFLNLKDELPRAKFIEPKLIQCNTKYKELIIYLHANREAMIKEDARIIISTKDLPKAINKVIETIEQRSIAKQPTSHINVTFDLVPVVP